MKVLVATSMYPPEIGRPAEYIQEAVRRLAEDNIVTIVAYMGTEQALDGNVKLVAIDKYRPSLCRLVSFMISIFREARNVDVVYVQNMMGAGVPVMVSCLILRRPFVLRFLGNESRGSLFRHLLCRMVARSAKVVIAPSSYMRDMLVTRYGVDSSRIKIVLNPVEKKPIFPLKLEKKKYQVCVLSLPSNWNDRILEVEKVLKEKYPDSALCIVGKSPKLTESSQMGTVFLGNISKAETWRLLETSSVQLIISSPESYPYQIVRSYMCKTSIIALDLPEFKGFIDNGQTGRVLGASASVEDIVRAIEKTFEDVGLSEYMRDNACAFLASTLSWDAHMRSLTRILGSVGSKP